MLSISARGYLFTYIAWLAAALISGAIATAGGHALFPGAAEMVSQQFNNSGWESIVGVLLVVSLLIAAWIAIFEIAMLILTPIFLRIVLQRYPVGRKATIIWMAILILLYPALPLLGLSIGFEPLFTLPALVASPALARFLATRNTSA
ncbi:MAG TPA: hypothetical protein VK983_03280 [Candidatus Limnocylindrales bacterium]|nr:hypothetical protein [Candidatus Limnocylindrales bacterium]